MKISSVSGDARYALRHVLLPALAVFCGMLMVAVFLFLRSRALMEREVRVLLRTSAALAALQFRGEELDQIRRPQDMELPVYHSLVSRLQAIRERVPNIRFAYILRRTANANILEFVADADSLLLPEQLDVNGNGQVDPDEEPSFPGDTYDITDIPLLQHRAFVEPSVEEEVTVDQWGVLVSGFAPIYSSDGTVAATLGIDMRAEDFSARVYQIFSPALFLLLTLGAVIFAVVVYGGQYRRRMETMRMLDEERTGFIQLALHRLGTPLTIFKWSLESLAECTTEKSCPADEVANHLKQTRAGIAHMDKIINAMLEAERIHGNRLEYHPSPVPLATIIHQAQDQVQPLLKEKNQYLSVETDADSVTVLADVRQITTVLHELLENASMYSAQATTITLRTRVGHRDVHISVEDHGGGIPEDEVHRVFQKFFRARNASRYNADGNGLGLYVARGIVERAGGTMRVESREGRGTTVTFTLPRAS